MKKIHTIKVATDWWCSPKVCEVFRKNPVENLAFVKKYYKMTFIVPENLNISQPFCVYEFIELVCKFILAV